MSMSSNIGISMAPAFFIRSSSLILSPARLKPFSIKTTPLFSARRSLSAIASASASPLEVCVKESVTVPGKLGDCPFSQRVLLTLEEKHLSYEMKLVDISDKPEWFLKISPEGKVPVAKLDDNWVADSDVITQSVEEKFPDPPLATPPEKVTIGSKIFSTFIGFLKSNDPNDGTEQALLSELKSFNDYIKDNGPFINGDRVSAVDLSLSPKLYHLEIALGHYKNWSIPESLPYVKSYMKNSIASNPSNTVSLVGDVFEFATWAEKFNLKTKLCRIRALRANLIPTTSPTKSRPSHACITFVQFPCAL